MTRKQWSKPEVKRIEAGSAGGKPGKQRIVDSANNKS
jgi:hypothetical protein